MDAPARKEWFYRYSPRNGGDLAELRVYDQVLDMWAEGKTKREICAALNIHVNTVKMIKMRAKHNGDPRAFAQYDKYPRGIALGAKKIGTEFKFKSVLEVWRDQYIVVGMAHKLEIHWTQIEAALTEVITKMETDEAKTLLAATVAEIEGKTTTAQSIVEAK